MSNIANIKNLWGKLLVEENIRTPYVILKEQASILTEKTNGLLIGNVSKSNLGGTDARIRCTLEIKVPSINNYLISIVSIFYPVTFYPLTIRSELTDNSFENCDTAEDLEIKLGKILSSKEVSKIISGLLSDIRADAEK